MYSIEELRRLCDPKNIVVTQHSRKRFEERGIKLPIYAVRSITEKLLNSIQMIILFQAAWFLERVEPAYCTQW